MSIVAEQCLVADALTKVVLARGMRAKTVLTAFGATAYHHSPRFGWRFPELSLSVVEWRIAK